MVDHPDENQKEILDLVIIGGGPSGMAAGIYAGRGELKAVLLDMMGGGGQMNIIDQVENYPGVVGISSGAELTEIMRKQMEGFGVTTTFDQVGKVELEGDLIKVIGSKTYLTRALLVASGATHRPLKVPGYKNLFGRGVSVCATCDGPFFKGQRVAVVGGGSSAIMETVYLSRIVEHVTVIHRRNTLRAEKVLQKRAMEAPNVDFIWDTEVTEILGEDSVSGLKLKNRRSGEESQIEVAAVFVFIGLVPNSEFLKGIVDLDEFGFIKTNQKMQTSHPKIFAAGDIRSDSARQIGTAVGDGITASVNIQEMLDETTPPRQHEKSSG
jgi:thioredoxin reductase (NADPH)